jgi:hypothetical protein
MTDAGPHILYRCYDAAGELLYIGITRSTGNRFAVHQCSTRWWPDVADIKLDESFASRWELEEAERAAILAEIPLHNVDHNLRWRTKWRPAPPSQAARDAMELLGELVMPRDKFPQCYEPKAVEA